MTLEWNFIGCSVVDWHISYAFYTQVLGFANELNPDYGDWALLGGGWDAFYAGSHGTVFELFDAGRPAQTDRRWGRGQGFRPAIHVRDLETSIAYLKGRGVIFTSEIEDKSWGRRIEFLAPESIYLSLLEPVERVTTTDWARPMMATVEIKAHEVDAQVAFYCDVLGFEIAHPTDDGVILRHPSEIGADKPQLIIENGGDTLTNDPAWANDPVRGHPFFLSVMTDDIDMTADSLREQNVTILKELQTHPSWGGTDVHIADCDGNALQVVQYA